MSDRPSNSMPVSSLKLGDRLGAYRIERELGSGGMADVYYAIHEGLRRPAAIKVLRASLASDEVHLQRFMQEARAAASLIHPNIVQVYDVGQDGDHRYIAQEYIPGSNLRQYLNEHGQMPLRETLSILLQILAALSKSATAGIVHRDIKPENIMLTEEGEVKVADYGLARVLLSDDPQLTRAGTTLGTPMYMSPEQIQEGKVDVRSDLYSLGVTLFHMLAGRPPFTGETPLALAMQHVQADPPPIASLRMDLPASIVELVHRLLAKDPNQRFNSPSEVLDELRRCRSVDLAEHWPDQTVPLPGALSTSRGPSAATLLLQAKLNEKRSHTLRSVAYMATVPLLALSVMVGGWLAASLNRRDLLAISQSAPEGIVKRPTVQEQYADALLSTDNRRRRWEAIPELFPPADSDTNRLYAGKAWLQLAAFHLDKADFQLARETLAKITEDRLMPTLLRTLAELRRAEVEEADRNERLAESAIKAARVLASDEEASSSGQELIEQFVDRLPDRLKTLWDEPK